MRSEWKYMLPFDLDLASSGFTDASGERSSYRSSKKEQGAKGMAQDVRVRPLPSKPACRAEIPQGKPQTVIAADEFRRFPASSASESRLGRSLRG